MGLSPFGLTPNTKNDLMSQLNLEASNAPDVTLREAQTQVHEWITTVGVRYFNELTNLAILTEEVGELARIVARRYGEQSEKASDADKDLGDEMADVLWVLMALANQTGVTHLGFGQQRGQRPSETKIGTATTPSHMNSPSISRLPMLTLALGLITSLQAQTCGPSSAEIRAGVAAEREALQPNLDERLTCNVGLPS